MKQLVTGVNVVSVEIYSINHSITMKKLTYMSNYSRYI